MTMTVGVIGLGNMGMPMARTLKAKGFSVVGTDLVLERRQALASSIRVVDSTPALFGAASVVILSLPGSREVEAVVLGPDSFVERALPGTLLIDTSTADPLSTRRVAAALSGRGFAMLDAPVSGGIVGAAEGQLTFMVGGSESALARAKPVFDALGRNVVHVGGPGAGNVAKIVHDLLAAASVLMTAEAVKLAEAAGIEPLRLLNAVNTATGRSGANDSSFASWVRSENYDPDMYIALIQRTVALAVGTARWHGVELALGKLAGELWRSGVSRPANSADIDRGAG